MREVKLPKKDGVDESAEQALDRLIASQGVMPIIDLDQLAALWPADDDPDALMNFVLSERQARGQIETDDKESR